MISLTYETVEDAFYFVSSAPLGEHVAVVNRSTARVYCASDLVGYDEMPDDLDTSDDYLDVPHRDQLYRQQAAAIEFIQLRCPEMMQRMRSVFARPGSYGRYKIFLAKSNLLEEWYVFEMDRVEKALVKWYEERNVLLQKRTK